MNSVLMWIGGLLAAVLAALFAVPYFVDWNGYRGVFEEEATRILGREVRVGGKINVRLLPTPYLSFEKLRIADTRLGATEPLFRTNSFTLWLSVPPLLQGNFEARHIALEQPVVTLAVDKTGTGNWTTLGIRQGALPFVPHNVALQAVDIVDGTLVLQHPRAGDVARLDGISGVISAEALDGPYKYSGDIRLAHGVREVRIVTAKADADGTIRFKATASPKDAAGAVYKLDGSLTGFSGQPEISGALGATLPLPELPGAPAVAAAATDRGDGGKTEKPAAEGTVFADLKGRLVANADRLAISDVVASIENVGQPQLITGGATLEWGRQRRLDFAFASRWLDLDRLAGATGRASPVGTATTLIKGLTAALPELATTRGTVAIDQLTLGGAPLAKLDLAMAREGAGDLRIERMLAELPAGARLALDGVVRTVGSGSELDGAVTLAGPSLARLAAWAMPDGALAGVPDGNFTLDSRVNVGAGRMAIADAKAMLSDHALKGSLTIADGALDVALSAETFESDWLWPGGITRGAVMAWLERVAGGSAPTTRKATSGEVPAGRSAAPTRPVKLRFTAAELRGPDRSVRDVVTDLTVADGRLNIGRLAFRGGDGFDVDVSGSLGLGGGRDALSGVLTGTLRAENAAAAEMAIAILELPDRTRTRQLREMTPLRLAGELALAQRGADSVDVKADGAAIGGRVTVRASLDGGLGGDWRKAPAEITLSGEDTVAERLMSAVFGRGLGGVRPVDSSAMRANVAIKAVGVPADGMVSDAALSREGLSLAYNGRAAIDADGVPTLAGTLEVAADRLGDVLALTGTPSVGGGNNPVTGTVGLSFEDDGRTKLTPSGLTVAGAEVSGTLRVKRLDGGRLGIDGEIDVSRASVPGLMSGLVQGAPAPMPASASDVAFQPLAGVWSDQPFAAAAFDQLEGKVSVRLRSLGVAPGIGLDGARMGLTFAPGQIDVTLDDDGVLGGRLRGNLVLAKAAAGARVKGELEIDGAELARLAHAAGSGKAAGGTAAASVAFSGQALSPRSLVTALRGSGRLSFKSAFVGGLTSQSVAQTVAGAFAKEIATDAVTLQAEILKRLGEGRLDVGSRDVALDVLDGSLRLARFTTRGDAGQVETLSTVDLATLQAETEWRLIATSNLPGKPDWPSVSIYYTGPLGSLAATEPRVSMGGFERELDVRRMEHEVEELERLRKLDEERARQERERQKALAEAERERQRALAEAARLERERQKALEEERLRQLKEEQQRGLPVSPAPRSDVPGGAGPAAQGPTGAAGGQPAITVPLPVGSGGGSAPIGNAAAGSEPAAGGVVSSDQGPPAEATGAAAATAPGEATAAGDATATAGSAATSGAPKRTRVRRPPSAGDTLMRSLNPGIN